ESATSTVVAGKPQLWRRAGILIVNNFSRNDRPEDELDTYQFYPTQSGTISRVRQRYNNTFDYVVQAADAIFSYNPALGIESCTDQAIANGEINLFNYRQVIWLSG